MITRKKAGRGYSRDDWIKHHQDIVGQANKQLTIQDAVQKSTNKHPRSAQSPQLQPAQRKNPDITINDTEQTGNGRKDDKVTVYLVYYRQK